MSIESNLYTNPDYNALMSKDVDGPLDPVARFDRQEVQGSLINHFKEGSGDPFGFEYNGQEYNISYDEESGYSVTDKTGNALDDVEIIERDDGALELVGLPRSENVEVIVGNPYSPAQQFFADMKKDIEETLNESIDKINAQPNTESINPDDILSAFADFFKNINSIIK